jgi:two-component system, OmpR family, sensor histidine kinase ChvG
VLDLEGLRYRVACSGAGPVSLIPLDGAPPLPPGSCQLRSRGYNVELRVPKTRILNHVGFRLMDFPVAGADLPQARTGTLAADQSIEKWPLTTASFDALSTRALAPPGVRLRVLAPDGFVLRKSGSLDSSVNLKDSELSFKRWLRSWVYRALLAPNMVEEEPYRFDNMIVNTSLTDAAKLGNTGARWRRSGSRATVVLTVAAPLDSAHPERGVILLEKTADALLIWSNRALGTLLFGGMLSMLFAASILFGYAGWLSYRVRRLKLATENALTPEGKLRGNFPRSRTVDEIGDLSRSFGALLDQVGDYNDYLRTLSSKLSHELSTPLAVVRSSLENLEHEAISTSARTYAQRAKTGADRLMQILRSMSEATRIERAIASAEGEEFDLRAVVTGATAAYRDLAGQRELSCEVPTDPVVMFGAPELIHQALDKLVDNALSFTPDSGWLRITLLPAGDGSFVLSVSNTGPTLPEKMRERLFDSLVSMRDSKPGSAHLGLGLYIVRLIAELHGGKASAGNLPEGIGVDVRMKLLGMRKA